MTRPINHCIKTSVLTALIALLFSPLSGQEVWNQEGVASYYAKYFHGRKTASGVRYDQSRLTAAHLTLPFGTVLEVTNLTNNETVIVEVNDRGPFSNLRILDLSYAAAEKIDMVLSGLVRVRITELDGFPADSLEFEPLPPPVVVFEPWEAPKTPPQINIPKGAFATAGTWTLEGQKLTPQHWGIQVGAFQSLANALDLGRRARSEGFDAFVQISIIGKDRNYRVVLGSYESVHTARESIEEIVAAQLPTGFPVRHI